MSRRLLIAAGGGTSFAAAPPAITVSFAWVGAVTDTSCVVKARSTDATSMTLAITGAPAVSGVEGTDDVWSFTVTGLTPNTSYTFGFPGSSVAGTIKTFPTAGSPAAFTVAAGGDSGLSPQYPGPGNTSDSPAFDRINDRAPVAFLFLGDIHYDNISTNTPSLFRTAYQNVLANDRFADLVANVPTVYLWDDHDYGPNDSDGTSASRVAAQDTFREYVPHYTLPADTRPGGDGEIYHSFVIGRVRFIMLDVRSERSPNGNTDNSSKTRIGTDQKAWLKAELLAATEPCIVLNVQSWWGDTTGFPDGWISFGTERQELAEYFEDNGLTSRLLMIGADIHELSVDDGTNTQFDPGAAGNGPPYFGLAPLDAGFNHFGGTFSGGVFQTRQQQYGTLAFSDDGTEVLVTVKGWAVTDGSEAQVFSVDLSYPG